jgi:hypothetical protein
MQIATAASEPRLTALLGRITSVAIGAGHALDQLESFGDRLFGPSPRGVSSDTDAKGKSSGMLAELNVAVDRLETICTRLNELADALKRVA